MALRMTEGSPEPLGLTLDSRGANIAVYSANATAIELCLFDKKGQTEIERLSLPFRTGDVFHAHVRDIREGQRYGLRAHGPYAPTEGHRFNPCKLLVDPYALALDRPFTLHPSMYGYRRDGRPDADLTFDTADSAPFMPKAVACAPARATPCRRAHPSWSSAVIYELHVRGMTRTHPGAPPEIRGTFAALSCPAVIEHLSKLGVTTLEIMPCWTWIDEAHLVESGLTNYWGYNPVAFMTPEPRLAPGGWDEARAAVAALKAAGFEVLVDVVLNHSGEGGSHGPTLSLRGLDNATYYMAPRDNPRYCIDDTGCGNTLALNRPPVTRLAMDALRAWVEFAGVDGFRFDLATTLGRMPDGFSASAPLLSAMAQDPVLNRLKLIAEPWDVGPGGYQLGAFPPAWGEWNDRFRDGMRRFWRGDGGLVGEAATRFTGSSDIFGRRRPSRSVNFVVAHDGFTLADLVSYGHKHNEANREEGRDGTTNNNSWNNGAEGPTDDPQIAAARRRDQRNLLATLLLARGAPMLAMGSETGQSQGGNNNAYCQDNPTSWLDWEQADPALIDFVSRVIALRRSHPALTRDDFLKGEPVDATLIPDIEWRTEGGAPMQQEDWRAADRRTLIAVFYAPAAEERDADRVMIVLHAGHEATRVVLPEPREGYRWRVCLDTTQEGAGADLRDSSLGDASAIDIAPHSVIVLDETRSTAGRRKTPPLSRLLDRLARAAGAAPTWRDFSGVDHVVSEGAKQLLLAGMGLPAASDAQARESLDRLAQETDHRPLPLTLTAHKGEHARLRIVMSGGKQPTGLTLLREDGGAEALPLSPETLEFSTYTGVDGRSGLTAVAKLPLLPIGRHRLILDHATDAPCRLTIAPARCFAPHSGETPHRAFGVAAQLYTVRRKGDQGIGDFTTLAELAEAAARRHAATIGINPLHALFPLDRERASPYSPSDRRFIDPIYLDVAALRRVADDPALDAALTEHARRFDSLAGSSMVDYPAVWATKRHVLDRSFAAFESLRARHPGGPQAQSFLAFVEKGGRALRRFACHEAISELRGGAPWTQWPAELAQAQDDALEAFAQRNAAALNFHLYLQWLCDLQLGDAAARARAAGLSLGFYRDLAVGAAPDGAESWANAGQSIHGMSIGAPPDPLAEGGQYWNLPVPNPHAWRRSGYASFRDLLAANMRHAGVLRIDHAMQLARLFVIPEGGRASEGLYVSFPTDDLIGELALESRKARCVVVGEDLGTTPDGFREKLDAANVLCYRVLWFERAAGGGFTSPATYPARSMACASTHDLPTLAGWWVGADIAEKEALGLISCEVAAAYRRARESDKSELLRAVHLPDQPLDGPLPEPVLIAVHDFIGQASSFLAVTQIDDLAGDLTAVNLPGTDRERPNWRRRQAVSVGEIFASNATTLALQSLGRQGMRRAALQV